MTDATPAHGSARFIEPLPANPNLDMQRKLAKALARDYWRGEAEAVARVQALHPQPPAVADFKLSDAQLVIARGYGFASWARLKHKIDGLTKSPAELFVAAVKAGDIDGVRALLQAHAALVQGINEPLFDFKQTAVHAAARNLPLLDLLVAHGADLNIKSSWEQGGFGILESVTPEQAAPLIARGARVDVWAAANLGMADELKALLDAEPALVNAKGGDGKRALHYAKSVEIAVLLLDGGAEIDAIDDDHSSTPAQYLVSDAPEVCKFLLQRGARSDLLMAAALGDVARVAKHLDDDPGAIAMRVSRDWFAMIDTAPNGGHIYQWTLGFHASAFDLARKRGHQGVLDLLTARAGPLQRLLDALWNGEEASADAVLASEPRQVEQAKPTELALVADAARNNKTAAVRAMLARGFPVTAVAQHGAMPLHWAAFHGNPEMLADVLSHKAPLDARDRDHDGPPMGWLIHGAANPWHGIATGKYAECARLLLAAGATVDTATVPTGNDDLDQVLRAHLVAR